MNMQIRVSAAFLAVLTAGLWTLPVQTQAPPTDWNIGDLYVGIGRFAEHTGKYVVYSPDGTLKETLVDTTAVNITQKGMPIGTTTGCMVAPSDYEDALYTTTFYGMRVMRFASSHPHALALAATVPNTDVDSIESIVFDNQGNYYVSGVPPSRDSASDPIPPYGYIFKYRRVGTSDVLQATYAVPNGDRGVDWLDLGTDQETFYYTSEGTKIHEFRPASSPLGPDYKEIHIRYPSGQAFLGTAYAMRALPPVPGSGSLRPSGFLVAMHSGILRVNYDGVIVQGYDVPGGKPGQYFALNITPDGQSFWTATFQMDDPSLPMAGHLYKFHIASGVMTKGPIPVQDSSGVRARSVWGLCVKREYTAAVNTCYELDARGGVKLDASGNPITAACRVPEICSQQGTDDDGDGLLDPEDPDCRNPGQPTIAAADRTSHEGDVITATSDVNVVDPVVITDPDGGPLKITSVTGLPDGLTWSQSGTGGIAKVVFSGTIPFGLITTTKTDKFGVKVTASDGDNIVNGSFIWRILRRNAPLTLMAPIDRTCTVGLACDTSFTVTINDPDADNAKVTATLPAGFTAHGLNNSSVRPANGAQSYPLEITGPGSFPAVGTHVFNVCVVDEREGKEPAYDPACISWNLHVTNSAPVITPSNRFTLVGTADSYAVPVSDPDGHALTNLSITNVPTGMTVSGNVVSGTATTVGHFVVQVSVEDEYGESAATTFTWVVSNDNTPPVLNLPPNVILEAIDPSGAPYTFTVTATDAVDPEVPVQCSAASGTFPLRVTAVTCSATDDAGNTATGGFTITVRDTTAPEGACTASFNPSTANVPRASRVNEDGFYVVTGSDAVSPPVSIALGSYPLQPGETVKLTQTPGFSGIRFINVMQGIRHFHVGSGDPTVTITDGAGNATSVVCAVPPK